MMKYNDLQTVVIPHHTGASLPGVPVAKNLTGKPSQPLQILGLRFRSFKYVFSVARSVSFDPGRSSICRTQ